MNDEVEIKSISSARACAKELVPIISCKLKIFTTQNKPIELKLKIFTAMGAQEAALAYDQAAFSMRGASAPIYFPIEKVKESLKNMNYSCKDGSSPAEAIKETHRIRNSSKGKGKKKQISEEDVLVLEDLGSDLLDELLSQS
ncbi:Ethylene-responsive transcription factor 1B [Abeliophyllum distichum]|uniref:Ethylene-responsive transcription factor 1B n=1 Tax=Abeliophyllum distichum TaxID=126358 RepID=A0ABD1RY29_9LAMI